MVGGNQSAGGYNVDNSVRLNSPDNEYMYHLNGTPTSDKKYTFSAWVKRSKLSHRGQFLRVINPSSTAYYTFLEFTSDDKLGFNDYNGTATNFQTNDKFRDTSAWYHFVIKMDTTQATSTDRFKIFINGVDKTSGFSTGINYPSLNKTIIATSSGRNVYIGGDGSTGGSTRKFDGYMAEVVLLDGQALDATSFGEFDEDSGIWKPIDVSGLTFGNNGFYLPFENSAALGQDDSGNGNNFTLNNLTSVDQSTDTCTNNAPTFNPLFPSDGTTVFSEGNLKLVSSGTNGGGLSTIGVSSGKWYIEVKQTGANEPLGNGEMLICVVGDPAATKGTIDNYEGRAFAYGIRNHNGTKFANTSGVTSWHGNWGAGDIISIALDMDSNNVYFAKNGLYANGSGSWNQAFTGSPAAVSLSTDKTFYFIGVGHAHSSATGTFELNALSPSFTISSGNSDGAGYGNFEYAPPSGYYALCTKNLAEYG